MNKACPLTSHMVDRSPDVKKDQFCSLEDGENVIDTKISYLSATATLIYFANSTFFSFI